MKDKLLQIIEHYGLAEQLKYIHTEYFELDEAIISDVGFVNKKHTAEEIADVMVMLKQFQYYYGFPDSYIENIMNYKIDRQIERIENE